jgi:hypothetical protein
MTTYTWTDLRTHAAERFAGQTPGPELEQRIIDVFQQQPQIVAAAIDYIAERFRAGIVRSPWPVLATHVEQATTTHDIQATDSTQRNRAIANAEQWIRTAGLHLDRASELEDDLFGDLGRLRAWASDTTLRQRMLTLWDDLRATAVQVERDQEQRLHEWSAQRAAAERIHHEKLLVLAAEIDQRRHTPDELAAHERSPQ